MNQILRLRAATKVHAEASAASEELTELEEGAFVEVSGHVDVEGAPPEGGWLLVRSPLEDKMDVMSDKPLEYQDGWIPVATEDGEKMVERAELQLGQKVAARVFVETHPVLDLLKKLPPWKDGELPFWMRAAVAELYTGKIGGVAQRSRFVVQRPSGAMPERVAVKVDLLVLPKERARQTTLAGLLGLAISLAIGLGVHGLSWAQGRPTDYGLMAWQPLVGWVTLIFVFLTPVTIGPSYMFANSQAATCTIVAWMNMLLYYDLFSE